MNQIFHYQQLAQLWQSLKSMQCTDDVFRHLDMYFKHDTMIEGTVSHDEMQTYYLVAYTTGEKRLTLTFTLSIRTATSPPKQVAHTAIDLTPDTFHSALHSVEKFMSLFY